MTIAEGSPAERPQNDSLLRSSSSLATNLVAKIGTVIFLLIVVLETAIAILAGCFTAKSHTFPRGYEEPALLASETVFSLNEVEVLYELFKKLSSSVIDDGVIHKEEFQLALLKSTTKETLFVDRVFYLFDVKNDGVIEFGEFVRSLSVFHPDASQEDKIDFTFRLYDLRQTGYIKREEVKQMIVSLLNESDVKLTDDVLEAILDKTFSDADFRRDGKIDREEWREFVMQNPSLLKNMTLPYLKNITTAFPSIVFNTVVDDLAN